MEELILSENALTGPIPDSFGAVGSVGLLFLRTLRINGNSLNGGLPELLVNLLSLEVLDVGDNQLTGFVPESIGNFGLLSK